MGHQLRMREGWQGSAARHHASTNKYQIQKTIEILTKYETTKNRRGHQLGMRKGLQAGAARHYAERPKCPLHLH